MAALWTRFQWWIWLVLVAVATALLVILRGLSIAPKGSTKRVVLPDVPPAIKKRVEKAEEAALVAKAESKVVSDAHKEKLQEIGDIADGSERRKRLANFVRDL